MHTGQRCLGQTSHKYKIQDYRKPIYKGVAFPVWSLLKSHTFFTSPGRFNGLNMRCSLKHLKASGDFQTQLSDRHEGHAFPRQAAQDPVGYPKASQMDKKSRHRQLHSAQKVSELGDHKHQCPLLKKKLQLCSRSNYFAWNHTQILTKLSGST